MATNGSHPDRFEVLIAGGGVAALEAMIALRDLAGDRVSLKLLAPGPDFVYRPLAVREPFALGPPRRYPLGEIAADFEATVEQDSLAWVDTARQVIGTE